MTCGVIELMSWGALYYTVPVLHERMHSATGWSIQLLTLTYSMALAAAALLGPRVGELIDRHGPHSLVVTGALLGGGGLAVVAAAPSLPIQAAGMLVVGVAQAATLYPPIFAALTIWFGTERSGPLTVVSLFGGVSSTIFAPSLAPLVEGLEWRGALLAVAIIYVAVTVPTAWLGLRAAWPGQGITPTGEDGSRGESVHVARSFRFRALQGSYMLAGVGLYAATLNLVGLAREQGYSFSFAATVFGLVGAGQVAGRLLYLPLSNLGEPRTQTIVHVSAAAATIAALGLAAPHPALFVVAAVAAGAVRGTHTLLMASGVADRWGTDGFGTLSGRFNRPIALGIATSPFIGSTLAAATGSYAAATLLLAALATGGAAFGRWT